MLAMQRLQQMQNLDQPHGLDLKEQDGLLIIVGGADTEEAHQQHLAAFGAFLERTMDGRVSPMEFNHALNLATATVHKDSATFPRQMALRPRLETIGEQWLEQNERMVEAYENARCYLRDNEPGHLEEALAIIESVLAERAPLYPYFD